MKKLSRHYTRDAHEIFHTDVIILLTNHSEASRNITSLAFLLEKYIDHVTGCLEIFGKEE